MWFIYSQNFNFRHLYLATACRGFCTPAKFLIRQLLIWLGPAEIFPRVPSFSPRTMFLLRFLPWAKFLLKLMSVGPPRFYPPAELWIWPSYIWQRHDFKLPAKFKTPNIKIWLYIYIYIYIYIYMFEYIFLEYFLWRWGLKNDWFSINKMYRSLDMNFISIKNMKWKFVNFSIFR